MSSGEVEPSEPPSPDDAKSDFRLEITIAVGYQRKRATVGGRWEGHLTTLVLLVAGVLVVLLILYRVSLIQWPL